MRRIGFRYYLLRGGAVLGQLRARTDAAPVIRMDDGGDIKVSFSGTFSTWALDGWGRRVEPNFLTDEIQPAMIVNRETRPLGVFLPATVRREEQDGVESVQLECYDRTWRVRDTNSESLLYWPRGTRYLDAVEQLLTAAGIQTVFKTPNAAEFTEDREDWDLGVSNLTVANQLLGEIGYKPVWFDVNGIAVLEPAAVPSPENIRHRMDSADRSTRLLRRIRRETDIFSAPNVFTVSCANPDKDELMVATAENRNPQSPLSTVRRGRRICSFQQVDNIPSQEDLQAYADKLRNESMITGETIEVSTGLRAGFGVDDVVALRYGDLTALCIERGYEMRLEVGGEMSHRLERIVYNLE